MPGIVGGLAGFSSKPMTRSLLVDLDDAEAAGVGDGTSIVARVAAAPRSLMEAQHLGVVHLVDVVAGQDDDVARTLALDGVEVLVDRVGGAQVPVLADALLRRQDLDELAELFRHDVPAHADVPVERQRLVLRRDEDAAQPGIDAVAEREIDDAVRAAKVDRRLGAILRERVEPLAHTAGEHDDKDVVHRRPSAEVSCPGRPTDRGWRSRRRAARVWEPGGRLERQPAGTPADQPRGSRDHSTQPCRRRARPPGLKASNRIYWFDLPVGRGL